MHGAPSVTYPVGRSTFAGVGAAVLLAGALAAILAWSLQSPAGWRQFAAYAAVMVAAAAALRGWLRSPVGELRWDGRAWNWEEGDQAGAGRLEIALDLQARLLLRWRGEAG